MNTLVIIEGTDNSGKDTLIRNLKNYYKDILVDEVHFSRPRSRDNKNAALEQNDLFIAYANMINDVDNRFIVFNRAWYGEYIYGTLYRERTKEDVEEIVKKCEKIIDNDNNNVTFIQLYGDSDFLEKNDDGQSLSEGKREMIEEEKNLFMEIFDKSTIKKKLKINVTKNGHFIPENEILNKVVELIEKK